MNTKSKAQHSGLLITIEGIEGAGKSTALKIVTQYIRDWGIPVLSTREPGGTQLGEKIRALVLRSETPIHPEAELLLLFACRAQHLYEQIWPALQGGTWVVCDRFTDASFAYQGGGRGIPENRISQLETWLQGHFRPDLTILLDIDPEIGMQRIRQERGNHLDRIEREKIAFFHKVRDAYLKHAEAEPERYRILDASCSVKALKAQLKKLLEEFRDNPHGSTN